MRVRFLSEVVAILIATAPVAMAQQSRNPAMEDVIQRQIDAFAADDLATAFSFASPNIQGLFGSAQNFGMMVRQGYPMVWRPGSVRFGTLRTVGGQLFQTVVVTDQAGAVHVLDYQMDPDGRGWEIDGVSFQRSAGVGA